MCSVPAVSAGISHGSDCGVERVRECRSVRLVHQQAGALLLGFKSAIEDERRREKARSSYRILPIDPRVRRSEEDYLPVVIARTQQHERGRATILSRGEAEDSVLGWTMWGVHAKYSLADMRASADL